MAPDRSTAPSRFDDFDAFASEIHNTPAPATPFLWPALYGGEAVPGQKYEVMFVFLKALDKKEEWQKTWLTEQCCCATEATRTHRCIFFDWAFSSPSAALFDLFGERRPIREFYKRFYITDLWKDHNPERRDYWLCTLRVELQCVPTQCVIFVGTEAAGYGLPRLKVGQVPRVPPYTVLFPTDRGPNKAKFEASLETLREQLRLDGRIPLS
jgi:hypothetical protein